MTPNHSRLLLGVSLALGLVACGDELQLPADPTPDVAIPSSDAGVEASVPRADRAADSCEATSPRAVPVTAWSLPDAGEAPFVNVLQGARSSVRVMVYMMGYGGILDALIDRARAGINVRVILDKGQADTNQKYYDQLQGAGVQVIWSDPKFPYMHAKMIVVDGRDAVISTGNFSKKYSIELERNFVAQVSDPDDVQDMVTLFDADWDRRSPSLGCTRLLVAPINARQRILALIDSAKSQLLIESMQLADSDVRARIAARKAAGVQVRAILANSSWISANKDAAAFLKAQGIEARTIPHCHVKAIVVDGARAYLGSENFSYTSLSKNREVGLVLTEPAPIKVMSDTFEHDWASSTAF